MPPMGRVLGISTGQMSVWLLMSGDLFLRGGTDLVVGEAAPDSGGGLFAKGQGPAQLASGAAGAQCRGGALTQLPGGGLLPEMGAGVGLEKQVWLLGARERVAVGQTVPKTAGGLFLGREHLGLPSLIGSGGGVLLAAMKQDPSGSTGLNQLLTTSVEHGWLKPVKSLAQASWVELLHEREIPGRRPPQQAHSPGAARSDRCR